MKGGGEMGRDPCGEIYPYASVLTEEVYDDTGWVSDSVDKMSRDHYGFGGDQRSTHPSCITFIKGSASRYINNGR